MPYHDALARPANDAGEPNGLAALRSEIDRIDDALIALIEQRLSHSLAIAELKQDAETALLCLRPNREREILDRLAGRAGGVPQGAIAAIWRELMALSLQAQQPTALVLHAPAQPVVLTNLVRLRFGCVAPIVVTGSPDEALHRARVTDAVAIVELSPLSGWWLALRDDPKLAIFDALGEADGRVAALAVGRLGAESLPPGTSFPILSEAAMRRRIGEGERMRTLAIAGEMRLCVSRGMRQGESR